MYRTDLHCHSQASPDGAISEAHIRKILSSGRLNVIAVTDHDRIDMAQALHAKLPQAVIVGEEITSRQGEIIGLFLSEAIPANLDITTTVERIKQQGGLVYVPHPFERVRKGLQLSDLEGIAQHVDLIEVNNGRSFSRRAQTAARAFAKQHNIAAFSSSDAHGPAGWGRVCTELSERPTAKNLVELARHGNLRTGRNGAISYFYPKLNRLRKARQARSANA